MRPEPEHIRRRQEHNRQIVKVLAALVEQQPTIRFGQLLVNMDVVQQQFVKGSWDGKTLVEDRTITLDPYQDESRATLDRMRARLGLMETQRK